MFPGVDWQEEEVDSDRGGIATGRPRGIAQYRGSCRYDLKKKENTKILEF